VKQSLGSLIDELEQVLPDTVHASATEADPEALARVCDQLARLLIEQDPESVDTFQKNSALLQTAFPDYYDELEKSLRSYEFDDALSVLAAVRRKGSVS
jgi:hypothetical protein